MSRTIKVTLEGRKDDLISVISQLPTEGIISMKTEHGNNRPNQVRKLKLDASIFNELFKTKPLCSESNTDSQSKPDTGQS